MNIKNAVLNIFGADSFGRVIQFLAIIYFARTLGARQMGIFFLFQGTVAILSIFADLGIKGAMEKRISGSNLKGEFLSAGLLLKFMLIIFIVVFIFGFESRIDDYIGINIATLVAIAVISRELSQTLTQTLRAELRVVISARLTLLRQFSWVGLGIIFVLFDYKAIGLVLAIIISDTIVFLIASYICSIFPRIPSQSNIKSTIGFAKFNAITGIGSRIYSWADVIILGLFLSPEFVGAYEIAWKFASIIVLFPLAIRKAVFPQISSWSADGEIEKISNLVSSLFTPALFLVMPATFGILLYSKEILTIVFSPEYRVAWLALILMAVQKNFQAINAIIGRTLQGINHPHLAAYGTLVGILSNVILNYLLIANFGLIGAALATLCSYTLDTSIRYYLLHKSIQFKFPVKDTIWIMTSAIIMSIILYILKNIYEVVGLFSLSVNIIVGATAFFLVVVNYRPIRSQIQSEIFNTES